MRLYDINLILEAKEEFTPEMFPIMTSIVDERRRPRYDQLLANLTSHLNSGELIQAEFNDLKSLNSFIEEAVSKYISRPFYHAGAWEALPDHLQHDLDTLNVGMHTIPGKIKKAQTLLKKGDHEVLQKYLALMNELLPLHHAQKKLKGMVVKKKAAVVKKAADAAAKTGSILAHEDVKRVKKTLTDVTKELRDEVLESNYQYLLSIVEGWYSRYDPNVRETENYRVNARNPFQRAIIQKSIVEKHREPVQLKKDYKKIILAEATKMTDDLLTQFINKQTAKIAEILVKKDNLKTVTLVDARTDSGIIEGLLKLAFEDNSSFDVRNKLVWAVSKLGTQFYRFPTTFHQVVMPDGKPMRQPSEERMKTVFTA